mmetsp:Transcript_20254/g.19204  ORF Transcript_20254/g.19204 Transcript_20254/m.19204 type:complete len:92 (+) Transcript_20254:329-604(+)
MAQLKFTIDIPLNPICYIKLKIPEEVSIINVGAVNLFGFWGVSEDFVPTLDLGDNSVVFEACSQYTFRNIQSTVSVKFLKLPQLSKLISSL